MTRLGRTLGLAVLLGTAAPASAVAADAYWNQLCTNGGWAFNTCASAWVTANGNQVTIRIWNLAGLPGSSTFENAGFTAIGLSSLGSGLTFKNLSVYYPNANGYAGWSFAQGGGGIPGPVPLDGVKITGVGSAIFSQYATSIPGSGNPAVTSWAGPNQFGAGYVSFVFYTYTTTCTGTGRNRVCVDTPTTVNLSNAVLGLHVQSGPNGASTGYECIADSPPATTTIPYPCWSPEPPTTTVTPEPVTVMLLGTGLATIGLVQLRRRRHRS